MLQGSIYDRNEAKHQMLMIFLLFYNFGDMIQVVKPWSTHVQNEGQGILCIVH